MILITILIAIDIFIGLMIGSSNKQSKNSTRCVSVPPANYPMPPPPPKQPSR